MPNDEAEQERMDMQHHIYLMIFSGELYRAPIPRKVGRVLDIGCGTGKWAIDFADMHPEADVVATDLSVIQPYWASLRKLGLIREWERLIVASDPSECPIRD